jgi:hypothetical protein
MWVSTLGNIEMAFIGTALESALWISSTFSPERSFWR